MDDLHLPVKEAECGSYPGYKKRVQRACAMPEMGGDFGVLTSQISDRVTETGCHAPYIALRHSHSNGPKR